jgi:putative mRNA 3-end processing factor
VSHAAAVRTSRHGQLIATAATLRLLGAGLRRPPSASTLAVPYGRPFTLGTRRVELFPSGHALGSASLLLDVDGRRVVYAGPVNPAGGGLGGVAEQRQCDVLVVGARYGAPRFAFPEPALVLAEIAAFVAEVTRAGGVAMLLVSSPAKGLDVAHGLARAAGDVPRLRAHPSIHAAWRGATQSISLLPEGFPPLLRHAGRVRPGEVLLWPLARPGTAARNALPPGSRIALVSGLACDPEECAAARVDLGFALSNQADHQRLLAYILASGAEQIFLTGGQGDAMVRVLADAGLGARLLGPPRQMSLFGRSLL